MALCPECSADLRENQSFCENCGFQLDARAKRAEVQTRGSVIMLSDQHKKHIRSARIAIFVVAVFQILGAIYFWFDLNKQIAEISSDPARFLLEDVVATQRMVITAMFVMGTLFFGLFYWAKSAPFKASLTAFLIYVGLVIVGTALHPESLLQGILFKVIIIVVLGRGMHAELCCKRLGAVP